MNKTLDTVLENITINNADDFNFETFEQQIQEDLPEYEIITWDMDDREADMASVARAITTRAVGKVVDDMQYAEWNTEECDLYVFVLAIKTI